MAEYMILTEKKSAAGNFAQALGGMSGSFDGHSYQIVHAQGHLMELAEPKDQVSNDLKDRYSSWEPENMPWNLADFSWKKEPTKGSNIRKLLSQIKKVSQSSQAIVIATDNDPSGEGELLAWEIINAIGWHGKVYREYHDDETPKSIVKAMRNLKDVSDQSQDGDYLKANVRSKWDFASMQLTRLATSYIRNAGYHVKVVNQGRLKSVMMAMVYKREQAIKNYVKKPYFEVKFQDDQGHVYARKVAKDDEEKLAKIRHSDKAMAEQELQRYQSPVHVKRLKMENKRNMPKTLLDLAKVDALLSKKGYSSNQIKNVYQQLYEAGYVSYPRTEDKVITSEQFNELVQNSKEIAMLVGVNVKLLTHTTPRKELVKDSATHGANRPGSKVPASLDELGKALKNKNDLQCAKDIYCLLSRTALAILGEDYLYRVVTAVIEEYPAFGTQYNVPANYNYKQIYCEGELPKAPKPLGKQAKSIVAEGANPKPSKPTKAWLFKRLANYGKYGIGTGATQQSTMAELTSAKSNSHLLKDTKGVLSLTETGLMSAVIAQGTMIASPKATEQLFQGMDAVGAFKLEPQKVLNSINTVITHDKPLLQQNMALVEQTIGKPEKKQYPKRDKVDVTYQGKPVQINAKWGEHTWTQGELTELSAGNTITFDYKKGQITGQLGEREYKGHKFIAFVPDFDKD